MRSLKLRGTKGYALRRFSSRTDIPIMRPQQGPLREAPERLSARIQSQ